MENDKDIKNMSRPLSDGENLDKNDTFNRGNEKPSVENVFSGFVQLAKSLFSDYAELTKNIAFGPVRLTKSLISDSIQLTKNAFSDSIELLKKNVNLDAARSCKEGSTPTSNKLPEKGTFPDLTQTFHNNITPDTDRQSLKNSASFTLAKVIEKDVVPKPVQAIKKSKDNAVVSVDIKHIEQSARSQPQPRYGMENWRQLCNRIRNTTYRSEASLEEHFVNYLDFIFGWRDGDVGRQISMQLGHSHMRLDLVLFFNKTPSVVIELKAPHIPLGNESILQLASYMKHLDAEFGILTNAYILQLYYRPRESRDEPKEILTLQFDEYNKDGRELGALWRENHIAKRPCDNFAIGNIHLNRLEFVFCPRTRLINLIDNIVPYHTILKSFGNFGLIVGRRGDLPGNIIP